MTYFLVKQIVRLMGWQVEGNFSEAPKSVVIAAPHTSAMDFLMGWFGLTLLHRKSSFIIKKEFFFFPIGILLRKMGAIPVKRGNRSNDMVNQMVHEFSKNERFFLVITPEGTRKKTKKWKRGFYEIAMRANVPITVSFVDYGRKRMGVITEFTPTGNFEADLAVIKSHYKGITARHPENFTAE